MFDLKDLNICFLAGTLGQGGAERQLFYTLKTLREAGAQIGLLCLTKGEYYERKIKSLGIPISWVGENNSKIIRLTKIICSLRKNRPHILQSQHFYTNLYSTITARLLSLKDVGAIRGNLYGELDSNGRILGTLSLRSPRRLLTNSQFAFENANNFGIPHAHLYFLPNVVDTNEFNIRVKPPRESFRLLSVGRLSKPKRVDRFLHLLARMRGKFFGKEVCGLVVGEGTERKHLERLAASLGLYPNTVTFLGNCIDMPQVYAQADVLVHLSDHEGTPNVILEAMASGLPILATPVGGVPAIVQHEITGFLAGTGKEEYLEEFLLPLLLKPTLHREMGVRARKYVEAHHSLNRLPSQLSDFYGKIISPV